MLGFLKQKPSEPAQSQTEEELVIALTDAEKRALPPAQRIKLRIDLANIQRLTVDPEKLQDAETNLRLAIILCAKASDPELFLACLDGLTEIFMITGNLKALEETALDAVRIGMSLPNADAQTKAARIYKLASAQYQNGRFEESIANFDQAISLREQALGTDHALTAELIAEVGRLCRAQEDHPKAQAYLKRALRIHEAIGGVDSAEANHDVEELAASYEQSGDNDSAATQYERALMLKLRQLGTTNIEAVAEMQYKVAALQYGWGNICRARELLESCIGTFRRSGGPRLAVAYETLAQVEEAMGRVSFAAEELDKASKVWEKLGEARYQELARNLEYRADLLDQLRERVEANWLRKRADQLLRAIESTNAQPA